MAQAAYYLLHTIHLQSCLSPCSADRIDFLQPVRCHGLVCHCTDSIMAAKHCNRGSNENCDSALNLGVEVASAIYSSLFLSSSPSLSPHVYLSPSVLVCVEFWQALQHFFFFFAKSKNGFSDVVLTCCSLTTFLTSLVWKQCDSDCFDIHVTSEEQRTRMLGLYRYPAVSSHFLHFFTK